MNKGIFWRIFAVAIAAVAFLAVGCGPKYPNCENEEHCKEHGEHCVDKLCRECGSNDHCVAKTGDACKICSANNTCVKEPGCCKSDMDCPGGKCWKNEGAETGRCGGECRTDGDCPADKECIGEKCVAKKKAGCEPGSCGPGKKCTDGICVWACQFESVYFDFNESSLTSAARKVLAKNVECSNTIGVPFSIEGHCDERGTEEYNLALGQRRANSSQRFLKKKGVKKDTMDTISYGEERPVCSESSESCWWRNRRAEFKIK
jgi:peptidoglycan-associated lipoprotein